MMNNKSLKRFANKPASHLLRASLLFCFLIQNVMLNSLRENVKKVKKLRCFYETPMNYLARKFSMPGRMRKSTTKNITNPYTRVDFCRQFC